VTDEEKIDTNECFGGVICHHCKHDKETIKLVDGRSIEINKIWCDHVGRSVVDIFYESPNARCQLNYWVKAVIKNG
jgi:hypothetical protein